MADEITITASLAFVKGSASASRAATAVTFDVTGSQYHQTIQNVGTTEEALSLGDIPAGGYCWIKNLDATNYVKLRQATGASDFIRIEAGEVALFRIDSGATAPFIIADTAACEVEILLIED